MIYISLMLKGGVGKSTIAQHLLPLFIHKKQKNKKTPISLFEFDEFVQSSKNFLRSSTLVQSQLIEFKSLEEGMTDIKYFSSDKDLILDVGAGQSVIDVIDSLSKCGINANKEVVFVLPYSNEEVSPLERSINEIEESCNNPNIVFILNRAEGDTLDKVMKEFIMFGSDTYEIAEASVAKKVRQYDIGFLNTISNPLFFARLAERSMLDIFENNKDMMSLDSDSLEAIWGAELGVPEGTRLSLDQFRSKMGERRRVQQIFSTIESFETSFDALESATKKALLND